MPRFVSLVRVEGSYFRMHEQFGRANQPMLPLVSDNHRYSLHLVLMIFYETSMGLESGNILPTVTL